MNLPDVESVAPERRLIGVTWAEIRTAYIESLAGTVEARALLEVLCLRETIRRMVARDLDDNRPAE